MDQFIDKDIMNASWFRYGVALITLTPVVIIILNEILYKTKGKSSTIVKPVRLFRNIILPLIAVVIVFTKVVEYDSNLTFIKVIKTIIYILLINGVLSVINTLFFSGNSKNIIQTKIPQLFLDIFRVMLVGLGATIVLSSVWGANLASMVTALGLGSFVLGLALQDTLGNLFSGIALIYERPFSVGDTIRVQGLTGIVDEINWRAVRLVNISNELIIIPHLIIGQSTVENISMPTTTTKITREIGYSYDVPPNKVKKALQKLLIEIPEILEDPTPRIELKEYGDSSITYEIEYAVSDYSKHQAINDEMLTKMWYMSNREGLDMPYPHVNLIFDKDKDAPNHEYNSQLKAKIDRIAELLPIPLSMITSMQDGISYHEYGKGEILYCQGNPTGELGLVITGIAKIFTKDKDNTTKALRMAYKDDFFGEISTLSNRTLSYSVVAKTDLEIFVLSEQAVKLMIDRYPNVVNYLGERKDTQAVRQSFNYINSN